MWHLVSDSACDLNTLEGTEGKIDFATIPFTSLEQVCPWHKPIPALKYLLISVMVHIPS